MNQINSPAGQRLLRRLVEYGMLTSIPNNKLYGTAYSAKLVTHTNTNGGLDVATKEGHYYTRVPISRMRDLCKSVQNGNRRAMDVIGAMYSLGFVLPKSSKLGEAWHLFSMSMPSSVIDVERAYQFLVKHYKEAVDASPDDKYLYNKDYYDLIKPYHKAFDFQSVELGKVRSALRERSTKLKKPCPVFSYAIPKGVNTLCVYRNTMNGAKLFDVLTVVDDKVVSILDNVEDIKTIPVTLSRDANYAKRTNSISGTKYDMFAVAGTLAIPTAMQGAAKHYLEVKSVKDAVEKLYDGSWLLRKSKPYRSKKHGFHIRNVYSPGEYLEFVATNVYGLTKRMTLQPIDLGVCLGQHLSSCEFKTLDADVRTDCIYLQSDAVTSAALKKTVNSTKDRAKTSPYKVEALVFRLAVDNGSNFIARL